jgi:hypothetical protein
MPISEAIQAKLQGWPGIVLWPTETGCAPQFITDEKFVLVHPPTFISNNPGAALYHYKRNELFMRWELTTVAVRSSDDTSSY